MKRADLSKTVWRLLKALPMVRFALMLGGGGVATLARAHIQFWLLHAAFPPAESIWLARITGAVSLGLAAAAIIGVVMVALAFGRVGRVAVNAGAVSVDLDFDGDGPGPGSPRPEPPIDGGPR